MGLFIKQMSQFQMFIILITDENEIKFRFGIWSFFNFYLVIYSYVYNIYTNILCVLYSSILLYIKDVIKDLKLHLCIIKVSGSLKTLIIFGYY
jgi:hypothetical protein